MTRTRYPCVSLLGATFETGNMGVGALTASSIKCILNQYPEADIFLLDYSKQSSVHTVNVDGRVVLIPVVNMRFSKKLFLQNNIAVLLLIAVCMRLIPLKQVRQWFFSKNTCLNHIQQSDIAAAISGGDSFSDVYGLGRFMYVSLPQLLVILLGKKLVLLPQTIGPFRSSLSQFVARYILRKAHRVYARDTHSLQRLEGLLGAGRIPEKCEFCYDVAFTLDPIPPVQPNVVGFSLEGERRSKLVGINISGLLFAGGSTRNNRFGLNSDYKELVYRLIDLMICKKGAAVLLVPHVFGAEVGSESDSLVCEQVFSMLGEKYKGRIGLVRGNYDQNQIKHIIGLCDFFVGSRMHACIAAVSQGVAAVSIAYSDKFLGVMESIGVASVVVDARKLGTDEILEAIDQSYEERALIHRHLEKKMPEVKDSVLSLFNRMLASPTTRLSERVVPRYR